MNLVNISFLSFSGMIGVVYIYQGTVNRDYPLLVSGVALCVYPFLTANVVLLSLLALVLIPAPFLIRKFISK